MAEYAGYVVPTLTLWVEAVKALFDGEFPEADFRNLWVSTEYPNEQSQHPAIWVDFIPTGDTSIVGIDHWEDTEIVGEVHRGTRWRFEGLIQLTVVTLTNLERARLVDHLVQAVAFREEHAALSQLQAYVQDNDLIALNVQWNAISVGGNAETPGTPWGTDDMMYEMTVSLTIEGEYVYAGVSGYTLVPLTQIVTLPKTEDEPDPPEWAEQTGPEAEGEQYAWH